MPVGGHVDDSDRYFKGRRDVYATDSCYHSIGHAATSKVGMRSQAALLTNLGVNRLVNGKDLLRRMDLQDIVSHV